MEAGGPAEFGVCAAMDVHYLRTGGAQAAAVLATDAAFVRVLAERTAVLPRVPPCGRARSPCGTGPGRRARGGCALPGLS